jgi:hypothetical protein
MVHTTTPHRPHPNTPTKPPPHTPPNMTPCPKQKTPPATPTHPSHLARPQPTLRAPNQPSAASDTSAPWDTKNNRTLRNHEGSCHSEPLSIPCWSTLRCPYTNADFPVTARATMRELIS